MVQWIPNYHFFGTGQPDLNYQNKLRDFPAQTEFIVVEDIQSEVVAYFNGLTNFQQIYNKMDGVIWQKRPSKVNAD